MKKLAYVAMAFAIAASMAFTATRAMAEDPGSEWCSPTTGLCGAADNNDGF